MISPLGVHNTTHGHVEFVTANAIQLGQCVSASNAELRHEGHVHQDNVLTTSPMLGRYIFEGVLTIPRILFDFGLLALVRIPIRDLPARRLNKASTG